MIQSGKRFSHLDFPRSCPTEVGRFIIILSSSGRFQMSFHDVSSFGCMHLRIMCVGDIPNLLHHQHFSHISSSLSFLTRFRYGAHTQCPPRIWAIVLEKRFGGLSRKDSGGGRWNGSVFSLVDFGFFRHSVALGYALF
jgi:hypothetical protein